MKLKGHFLDTSMRVLVLTQYYKILEILEKKRFQDLQHELLIPKSGWEIIRGKHNVKFYHCIL